MTDPQHPSAPDAGPPDAGPPGSRSTRERIAFERERVVRQSERARARIDAARPRSPAIDSVMRTIERDTAAGGGVLAGAVAFRIFMFMVPFVFLLVGVFGIGSSASNQDPQDLARQAGITGIVAKALSSVGDLSFGERLLYVVVVGFATFLATRALLKVLRIVHALVWHTRAAKPRRSWVQVVWLLGIVMFGIALSSLIGVLRGQSFLIGLAATLLYVLIPVVLWTFVSWHLPHADVPWSALLPGAVVFGVGLELMHVVTVYWIAHLVESKTETYGAIGFALVLLFWAYLVGRLITTAAVVNESLWTRHQEQVAHHRHGGAAQTRRGGPEGPPRSDQPEWGDG